MAVKDIYTVKERIILLCTWFAASASLLSDLINQLALYVALPLAFILSCNLGKSRPNKYMKILFLLYIWIAISLLWATNTNLAFRQLQQILGAFVLCFILSVNALKQKNLPWLYTIFIILLIGDWYYAYNNIFGLIDLGVDRMDDEKLNANSLAYHTFYVTMAVYFMGDMLSNRLSKLFKVAFLFIIPLSFYTAILTASRQVLLIQLPLICVLLYCRYWEHTRISNRILFLFVACGFLLASAPKIMEVYDNSTLKARSELNINDDSRTKLAKDAFQVAIENLPFGVGANNYMVYSYNKHFSHNNYLELLANEGIIGLFLYLWLVLRFLQLQIKRFIRYNDKMFIVFSTFGAFYIIDGIFYVFYPQIWLISFFILVATHSETYYRNKYISYENKRNTGIC